MTFDEFVDEVNTAFWFTLLIIGIWYVLVVIFD